jgi:hypothetical protein
MRSCDYCGKENDDTFDNCAGCGCSLIEPKLSLKFPWAAFFAWAGLVIGILGTGYVALISFPFYGFHHQELGHGVMIWMAFVFMTGFWSFLIGLPCAIVGIIKGRRLIGWLGVLLVLLPVPLGWAMLKTAMALNGLTLED